MKRLVAVIALIAVIAGSAAWAGFRLHGQRPTRPVPGLINRSKVDRAGHTRGIVQVDLMRQIMADRAETGASIVERKDETGHRVPSQSHALLGRPAPALVLGDAQGTTRELRGRAAAGPVVVVFYLGFTCMACVTHLVELEAALPRFRERGAEVWAVSADSPEFSRERMRRYGRFQIPLLSDPVHAVSTAYGVWKPVPGGEKDEGEALHGTFIIDRGGSIRWAYLGDRPFADIDALLTELDRLTDPLPRSTTPIAEAVGLDLSSRPRVRAEILSRKIEIKEQP
jgi:peroxiredoxin